MNRKLNLIALLVLLNLLLTLAWISFGDLRYCALLDELDRHPRPAPAAVQAAPVPPLEQPSYLDQLRKSYGPKLYSQFDEETLIRHFFKDMREGFFVDVGAADPQRNSTTFYLEKHLGWKGIALDANESYKTSYAEKRPQTKFFCRFVADTSDQMADFFLPLNNPDLASGIHNFVSRHGAGTNIHEVKVPTITLNKLLAEEQVRTIDFLSMDIEGSEPAALAGFDIQRFKPRLVCIEVDHAAKGDLASRGLIEDYFRRNGYQRVEDYVPFDPASWYFTPATSGRKARPLGMEGTSQPEGRAPKAAR